MSRKEMALLYYYVVEDKDTEEQLNVFEMTIDKHELRLIDVYDKFPLTGTYIFRFKIMYQNEIAWLDLPDLQSKVPTYKDKIIMKVNRVSWESNHKQPYGHYKPLSKNTSTEETKTYAKTEPKIEPSPKLSHSSNLLD